MNWEGAGGSEWLFPPRKIIGRCIKPKLDRSAPQQQQNNSKSNNIVTSLQRTTTHKAGRDPRQCIHPFLDPLVSHHPRNMSAMSATSSLARSPQLHTGLGADFGILPAEVITEILEYAVRHDEPIIPTQVCEGSNKVSHTLTDLNQCKC